MRHRLSLQRLLGPMSLAVLALLAAAQPAAAARYAAGSDTRILDRETDPELVVDSQPVSAHSTGGQTGTASATAAVAAVTVTTGAIHLSSYSSSEVMQGPGLIYSQATARGGFSDSFVLAAAKVAPGVLARITVAFGISGALGVTGYYGGQDGLGGGARSEWRARFDLHGNQDGVIWEGYQSLQFEPAGNMLGGNASVGQQLFSFDVVLGETLWLDFSATVDATSGAVATVAGPVSTRGAGHASFGNTMSWQGIVSLTDSHGAPIVGFSALSPTSGFDYAQAYVSAVPEPASWLLSLCGAAFFSVVRGKLRCAPARRPAQA
jgi:hypothetical protein